MAAPFVLRVCQRPVHCFLKLRPLVCFIKSPSPCLGGSLVHACSFGTSAVDNASELLPLTSGLHGPQQNKFERQRERQHYGHHHGVAGRWHCPVWRRGKQPQADSMHTLRSYYWMVHSRSFKTKRSAGDITDEVEGSQYRQPTEGSGSSHSDNSAWVCNFILALYCQTFDPDHPCKSWVYRADILHRHSVFCPSLGQYDSN